MIKLTSTKIWTNDLAQFDDSLFYCAEAIVTDVKGIEGTEFPAQCRFQTAAYFGKGNAGHKPIAWHLLYRDGEFRKVHPKNNRILAIVEPRVALTGRGYMDMLRESNEVNYGKPGSELRDYDLYPENKPLSKETWKELFALVDKQVEKNRN